MKVSSLQKKFWFTLVETILTILVMSILIWIIFEIFSVISHIAIYTQQQKYVHNEIVFVMQTMQNLVDDQNMVLSITWNNLWSNNSADTSNGFRNEVVFTNGDLEYIIWISPGWCSDNCYLNMTGYDVDFPPPLNPPEFEIPLTNTEIINVTNFLVKVLPYDPETSFETKFHEWFWMFLWIEVAQYNPDRWWFDVSYDLQSFFSVRKY